MVVSYVTHSLVIEDMCVVLLLCCSGKPLTRTDRGCTCAETGKCVKHSAGLFCDTSALE